MKENDEQSMLPELIDIRNRILAYNTVHPEGCFLFSFVGFKKDKENICEECGDYCDCVDDTKSIIGAYGNLETLRIVCNEMRDFIEDSVDEDGFVNS